MPFLFFVQYAFIAACDVHSAFLFVHMILMPLPVLFHCKAAAEDFCESNPSMCVCLCDHCSWPRGTRFMDWTVHWQTGNWKITWGELSFESLLSWWVYLCVNVCALPFIQISIAFENHPLLFTPKDWLLWLMLACYISSFCIAIGCLSLCLVFCPSFNSVSVEMQEMEDWELMWENENGRQTFMRWCVERKEGYQRRWGIQYKCGKVSLLMD